MSNSTGLSLFRDVQDKELQAYNRLNALYNLKGMSKSKDPAKEYASQITVKDKLAMVAVAAKIKLKGLDNFKAELSRRLG